MSTQIQKHMSRCDTKKIKRQNFNTSTFFDTSTEILKRMLSFDVKGTEVSEVLLQFITCPCSLVLTYIRLDLGGCKILEKNTCCLGV